MWTGYCALLHQAASVLSVSDANKQQPDIVEFTPIQMIPRHIPIRQVAIGSTAVANMLDVSEPTLRGWISRGQFPPKDAEMNGKAPIWLLTTILEYLRNAPGGRLPYTVE